jgi:signal peptidase I
MKLSKKLILLSFTWLIFIQGPAIAELQSKRTNEKGMNIQETDKGISINIHSQSLQDVFRIVQSKYDVQVSVRGSLNQTQISGKCEGPTWKSVIISMLKGFNTVQLWSENQDKGRIWILGDKGVAPLIALQPENNNSNMKSLSITGRSMEPTLYSGNQVWMDADYYNHHAVNRRDLVAVRFKNRDHSMVKRVVALPDDRVEIANGQLMVNSQPIIKVGPKSKNKYSILHYQLKNYQNRVPHNQFIVFGDNQNVSFDSIDFGIISRDQIEGRIIKKH